MFSKVTAKSETLQAEDNASGVALLLAIARAFAALPYSLGRSIIFLTVTAEEKGSVVLSVVPVVFNLFRLVGSQYYVEHPAWPLKKTLLNINYDMGNVYGKTEDVVGLGIEHFEDLRILFEVAVIFGYNTLWIIPP